jgi:hypothetical protein
MDKIPKLPPDPVEAAQVPVDEGEVAARPPEYVENEGLIRKGPAGTDDADSRQQTELEEADKAALRGRTA